MAEAGFWRETEWWRNTGYDVVHETHIGPVEEEWERYNPLEVHETGWKEKKQEKQPVYVELAQLDRSDPNQIAYWCADHGLLGILPHRTIVAYLWPRSGEQPVIKGAWYRRDLRSEVLVGRLAGRVDQSQDPGEPILDLPLTAILPEPVDEPPRHPHTLILGTDEGLPYEVDLVEGVAQFFPDVNPEGIAAFVQADPARRSWGPGAGISEKDRVAARIRDNLELEPYPIPFSKEFARRYCEPISLFREYADRIERRLAMWEAFNSELPRYGSISKMLSDRRWSELGLAGAIGAVQVVPIAKSFVDDMIVGNRLQIAHIALHPVVVLGH